jgi:hypothetical protein
MSYIIYKDEYFENGVKMFKEQQSKVYGTFTKRFPSGNVKMIKVWSTRLNAMINIRADHQLVSVIS